MLLVLTTGRKFAREFWEILCTRMRCGPSRAEHPHMVIPDAQGLASLTQLYPNGPFLQVVSLLIMRKTADLPYVLHAASHAGSQLLLLGWDSKQQARQRLREQSRSF